jgi:hypothetical protein
LKDDEWERIVAVFVQVFVFHLFYLIDRDLLGSLKVGNGMGIRWRFFLMLLLSILNLKNRKWIQMWQNGGF